MVTRQFDLAKRYTVSPTSGWQWDSGFFTSDHVEGLVGYHPSNGTIWVGDTIASPFTFHKWATVTPSAGWRFTAGDFSGTGRTDLVGYFAGNGTLWLGENVGGRFTFSHWGDMDPHGDWQFAAGVFTGHSKADLVGLRRVDAMLCVGTNTGTAFAFTDWTPLTGSGPWQIAAADFTGNGRADVAAYDSSDGSLWVGANGGDHFDLTRWATMTPAAGWQFAPGFFTNRGKADLFGYQSGDGSLWVGANSAGSFGFDQWKSVEPSAGWQFVAGAFDADLWADIAGYHPSNGTVWLGRSVTRPVEGYCWPLSAAPGETIDFMVSAEQSVEMSVNRHTSMSADVDATAMEDLDAQTVLQAVPPRPWRVGCGWTKTTQVVIPPSWRSGLYSASFVDEDSASSVISFVVKPAPSDRSQVAVLANVNTWLAYNAWGGQSKYTGLARTSFLRPNPGAAPESDGHLTRGELWILGWLEQAGYRPDLYTDIDFHNDSLDPAQYRCLVVGTHPEYWTTQMYDNLLGYLAAGGSLAYLGGNGLFETGEYDDDQTTMIFRLGVEGGPRSAALFRVHAERAERAVLGVATERCGVLGSPYVVREADHQLFVGTGVSNGDEFGTHGFNLGFGNGQASAWEVDTQSGRGATSIPTNCVMDPENMPASTLPSGTTVIAQGRADGGEPGADMVFYEHPGGGCVFSAGSITFGGSLVADPVLQGLMHNVFSRAGVLLV